MQERDPNGLAPSAPGAKLDDGKLRADLTLDGFSRALLAVAEVSTFGARKYSPGGWQRVPEGEQRYRAAGDRHRLARGFDAALIAQAGIARVLCPRPAADFAARWAEDIAEAQAIFRDTGVTLELVEWPSKS